MARRRIEFDPDAEGALADVLNAVVAYREAVRSGEFLAAARAASRVEHRAPVFTDRAIAEAAEVTSARRVAAELEMTHGAINYRLKTQRADRSGTREPDEPTGEEGAEAAP